MFTKIEKIWDEGLSFLPMDWMYRVAILSHKSTCYLLSLFWQDYE
jgi:hypothetical protein